ncbi:MAG: pilin [Candidatus Parcubacteria bacterium]|nr:pilin [Candidatus Parcubacteria bacterium]
MKKLFLICLFTLILLSAFIATKNASAYTCGSLNGTCQKAADCLSPLQCTVAGNCTGTKSCCCAPTCSNLGGECKDSCGSQTDLGGSLDCPSPKKCCDKGTVPATTPPAGTGTGGAATGGGAAGGTVTLVDVSPVGTVGIPTIIGKIIKAFLGFIGAVALLMFVYGGFLMLISGGKPEEINKGKNVLVWAVIGLIVVFMSYTLANFVITSITSGGGGTQPGSTTGQSTTQSQCAARSGDCLALSGTDTCASRLGLPSSSAVASATGICPTPTDTCCYLQAATLYCEAANVCYDNQCQSHNFNQCEGTLQTAHPDVTFYIPGGALTGPDCQYICGDK